MKISVITVTYNCASVVNDCLYSVLNQSYSNVDHLVIDGASSDGTISILKAHSKHLEVLLSEADRGIFDAMNKGIKFAKGDVIGFLNSDDFYAHKNVLTKVAKVFTDDTSIDACFADLIYTDKIDTSHEMRYWQSNNFSPGAFSTGWSPPHPTFYVRRSVYERFGGFDLSYGLAADVELMMRFLELHKLRVKYIPDVWVKMRMGGASNSNWLNVLVQNQQILRALKNHKLSFNPFLFFAHKLWSRCLQFVRKPS